MNRPKSVLPILNLPQIMTVCCAAGLLCAAPFDLFAASVVQRGTAPSRTAPRANNTNRLATVPPIPVSEPVTVEKPTPDVVEEEVIVVENKSSQFDKILDTSSTGSKDIAGDELADMIRRQRNALDAAGNQEAAAKTMTAALAGSKSTCDTGLRTCMREKCDNDFSKCSGDGDTIWGDKMNACRRDLTCTGEEYRLFAIEIKADRDFNAQMTSYTSVLDCGNRYNDCIIKRCGTMLGNCIGKADGDAAIASCATIAKNCQTSDNGLANRMMQVFATLRNDASVQVKKDEARLYELRDSMANQCKRFGAMFDERSLDCVFTVSFFANNSKTPYASKKAYAGSTFDCDQNWFGVDVTTFKENAYRLTREQKAASSALMGAGLGVAAGAISSGAIDRAMDTQKAKKAAKEATNEHKENFSKPDEKEEKVKPKTLEERQADSKDGLKKAQDKALGEIDKDLNKANEKLNNGTTADTFDRKTGINIDRTTKNLNAMNDLGDIKKREQAEKPKETEVKDEKIDQPKPSNSPDSKGQ